MSATDDAVRSDLRRKNRRPSTGPAMHAGFLTRLSQAGSRGSISIAARYSVFERSMPSGMIRGWVPVCAKKARQDNSLELRF